MGRFAEICGMDAGLETAPEIPSQAEKRELTFDTEGNVSGWLRLPEDSTTIGRDRLMSLVQEALGEYVGAEAVLELGSITFGRHSSGGTTVWLKNCKVQKSAVRSAEEQQAVEQYVESIVARPALRRKPSERDGRLDTDLYVPVADPQVGKGTDEHFGSLDDTARRFNWMREEELPRIARQLKADGRRLKRIVIPLMGDLTEGCHGSYENQMYTVQLNATEQAIAARALVDGLVEKSMMLADEVWVTGVASNHDRATRNGKTSNSQTDDWDDRTFLVMSSLAYAYSKNPKRYEGRVKVFMPQDPNEAYIQHPETGIGIVAIHGHLPKFTGKTAQHTMAEWWWDQRGKNSPQPSASASVLISAHYHHHFVTYQQGLVQIGCPSLDGGSQWFTNSKAIWSMPGFTTFTIDTEFGVRVMPMSIDPEDRKVAKTLGVQVA